MLRISERYLTLTIPGGTKALGFEIGAQYYGFVKRVTIKQTGGTNYAATVNLYSRPVVATQVGGTPRDTTTPPQLAAIIPQISVSSGAVGELSTPYEGYAYRTTAGPSGSQPEQKIYLYIDQSSTPSTSTTWSVCIVIAEPL